MSIDGIVTGYEERFDWPPVYGTRRPYMLASVPRTGSTFLSHLLWRTGSLGAPLEYLNFEATGPYGSICDAPSAQLDHWQRILARRTSPNGVFGVKVFPLQMEVLGRANPSLLARAMRFLLAEGSQSKVVQLRRRDTAGHAISLARASLSGVWRAEQERGQNSEEPTYSKAIVERAMRELQVQEQAWQQMYRETGISPLMLWYEDVVEAPEAAVGQVADYLGVELDPTATVDVPEIRQQDQAGAQKWRKRYGAGALDS